MNNRQAKALVAAYLARKAADTLHTHVGASLLRAHLKQALGEHPEGADLERVKRAVVELADELAQRGNVDPPFGRTLIDDSSSLPEPHHASTHRSHSRARRRVRG